MGARLELLAPDLKEVLFTLTFKNLGIFKVAPEKAEAGSESIRRVKAESGYLLEPHTACGVIASEKCPGRDDIARIVLATPVAPPGLEHRLVDVADEFVCLDQPRSFAAVGQFYENFDQTTDAQVVDALAR